MQFIRRNIYMVSFIAFFVCNIGTSYYYSQEIVVFASAGKALWFTVVFAFVNWAWDSKDYKKSDKS
ncbi:hypothetical protein ACQKII_19730 [Lysinibacillus sp. NPDC048646]|uniref:hypothetical protein n=1 Tax=Lysinibacillus sp. NPDC048646 TaxID=3390574 RepID=UPI003D08D487